MDTCMITRSKGLLTYHAARRRGLFRLALLGFGFGLAVGGYLLIQMGVL